MIKSLKASMIVATLLLSTFVDAKVGEATFEVIRETIGESDIASQATKEVLDLFAKSLHSLSAQHKVNSEIMKLQLETPPHKSVIIWLGGLQYMHPASESVRSELIDLAETVLKEDVANKQLAAISLLEAMASVSPDAVINNWKSNMQPIHQERVLGILNDALLDKMNRFKIDFKVRAAQLLLRLVPLNSYIEKRRTQMLVRFAVEHRDSIIWEQVFSGLFNIVTTQQPETVQKEILRMFSAISIYIHNETAFGVEMIGLLQLLKSENPVLVAEKFLLLTKFVSSTNREISEAAFTAIRNNLAEIEATLSKAHTLSSTQRKVIETMTGTNWPHTGPSLTKMTKDSAGPVILKVMALLGTGETTTFEWRAHRMAQALQVRDSEYRKIAAEQLVIMAETIKNEALTSEQIATYLTILTKEMTESLKITEPLSNAGFDYLSILSRFLNDNNRIDAASRMRLMAQIARLGGSQQKDDARNFTIEQIKAGILDCGAILNRAK